MIGTTVEYNGMQVNLIFDSNEKEKVTEALEALFPNKFGNLDCDPERKIYDKLKLAYRTADAEAHVLGMIERETDKAKCYLLNQLEQGDFKAIAEQFINKYDCNCAENDMFECIIENYIEEMKVGK